MKISFVPCYRPLDASASTRLRVFYPNIYINRFYRPHESYIENWGKADAIIIQKVAHEKLRNMLSRVKKGRKVFFDYMDDIHKNKWFRPLLEYVDVILVDNLARLRQVQALNTGKPIELWEDPIDYNIPNPMPPTPSTRLCWFGNYPNIRSIKWQLDTLYKNRIDIFLISSKHVSRFSRAPLVQWNLRTFVGDLRRAGLTLLSHQSDNTKSHNKLLVSLTAGLPAIVGESASYEALLRRFNLDFAICRSEGELLNAIRRLKDSEQRKLYLSEIQPFVWNNFNPRAAAGTLLEILKKYV